MSVYKQNRFRNMSIIFEPFLTTKQFAADDFEIILLTIYLHDRVIIEKNRIENIVAQLEIAHHEQFLLLAQCFQKLSATDASKCVCKSLSLCLFSLGV